MNDVTVLKCVVMMSEPYGDVGVEHAQHLHHHMAHMVIHSSFYYAEEGLLRAEMLQLYQTSLKSLRLASSTGNSPATSSTVAW